jgi:cobalt-zinc-cadmium efflux system membrane fusion protein
VSPISGRITARNAAPGLLGRRPCVQPGNTPAPYTVADISTMWMVANVAESDSPAFNIGQEVKVTVMAHPGRGYEGRISTIGSIVDPLTHRVPPRVRRLPGPQGRNRFHQAGKLLYPGL